MQKKNVKCLNFLTKPFLILKLYNYMQAVELLILLYPTNAIKHETAKETEMMN